MAVLYSARAMAPERPTFSSLTESDVDRAVRALIVARLSSFALYWMLLMLAWTVALSLRSIRALPLALAVTAFHGLTCGAAVWLGRRHGTRWSAAGLVLGMGALLGVTAAVLFVRVGSVVETLGFVLFSICSMAALMFPWGWRRELTLVIIALVPLAVASAWIAPVLPPLELTPVIVIAAMLCVATAEGNTRSFRAELARRRSEEAALRELAASRDTYRDISEFARDFIWAADLDGRVTYVNETGARLVGLPRHEIVGRNLDHIVVQHPSELEPGAMRARLLSGDPLPPTVIQMETTAGRLWMEVLAYVVRDADGHVIGFRGITRDVTERTEAERALRESEARYRGLVESQEQLIYRSDLDGNLTFLNDACRRKYGVTDEPLDRLSFLAFVHPDDVEDARGALRAIPPAGTRYRRTSRGRTVEGWRWIEWEVCTISDASGAAVELQGVGHDVTERRAADEALQHSLAALREREEQLRLMALQQVAIREEERKRLSFDLHDGVCQELVGIGILIESARQRGVSEDAHPALAQAQRYLRQVGEHVRMLARDLRPLQLADLGLGECLRALAAGMTTETVHVTATLPAAIPRLGEDTEVAVYRVAQEAVANAVRHADARSITMTIGASNGVLRLEVRDDGRGFDRGRLHSAALGLIAMEERAAALGGRLRIDAAPGAGTTVRLECPLRT